MYSSGCSAPVENSLVTSFGYNIRAAPTSKYSPRNKKGVPHKYNNRVAVVDENNKVVRIYENAATAAQILGLQTCNITEVCKTNKKRQIGKKRKTGGYIFEFIEE